MAGNHTGKPALWMTNADAGHAVSSSVPASPAAWKPRAMPTFAEALVLLTTDESGTSLALQEDVLGSALAGTLLLELAFANRIDTDLEALVVIDRSPTGDAMQDHVLAKIANCAEPMDARTWIRELSGDDAGAIADAALARLVRRGVLARPTGKPRGNALSRRHRVIDAEPKRVIANRVANALLANDIPEPRDIALVSLLDACEALPNIPLAGDAARWRERARQLRSLDLIGREVASAVADIQDAIIRALRARAAKFRRLLLLLSTTAGMAVVLALLAPSQPAPRGFHPSLLERLWFGDAAPRWSGYLLAGCSIAALAAALRLKTRVGVRNGGRGWRLGHLGLGLACLVALFAHTGFRLGANLNAALMGCYLGALLFGALVGVFTSGAALLRRFAIATTARQLFLRLHLFALLPLPALLIVHVLVAYLY